MVGKILQRDFETPCTRVIETPAQNYTNTNCRIQWHVSFGRWVSQGSLHPRRLKTIPCPPPLPTPRRFNRYLTSRYTFSHRSSVAMSERRKSTKTIRSRVQSLIKLGSVKRILIMVYDSTQNRSFFENIEEKKTYELLLVPKKIKQGSNKRNIVSPPLPFTIQDYRQNKINTKLRLLLVLTKIQSNKQKIWY